MRQEDRGRFRDDRGGPPPMRYTARPDGSMTQLWLSVGEVDGVTPRDIVGCILGETGLHASIVGKVQLFDRHTLVEVTAYDSQLVLERLNRAVLRGRQLRAKPAGY
jgi:ATP-dependent RNA helicase DeaD